MITNFNDFNHNTDNNERKTSHQMSYFNPLISIPEIYGLQMGFKIIMKRTI